MVLGRTSPDNEEDNPGGHDLQCPEGDIKAKKPQGKAVM
jgi:hypothetical protein